MSEEFNRSQGSMIPELAALSDKLAKRVNSEFGPIVGVKDELRGKLAHSGLIHSIVDDAPIRVDSMAAVDGARIQEKLYAADFLVAVATLANARLTPTKLYADNIVWADILQHADGTDRISQTAMGSGEVRLLAESKHEIRIMDGSLVTPLIMLREGLYLKSAKLQGINADLLAERRAAEFLSYLIDRADDGLVSVAKSDSATYFAREYDEKFGLRFPTSDRFLATQILQPGEILHPRVLHEVEKQAVENVQGHNKTALKVAAELDKEYQRIAKMAKSGLIYTTYFRPYSPGVAAEHIPNVLRIEFTIRPEDSKNVVEVAKRYANIINADMVPPFMLEPFCQHTVDAQAKGISSAAKALKAKMLRDLPADQAAAYKALLGSSYRTS